MSKTMTTLDQDSIDTIVAAFEKVIINELLTNKEFHVPNMFKMRIVNGKLSVKTEDYIRQLFINDNRELKPEKPLIIL